MDGITRRIRESIYSLIDSGAHISVAKSTEIIAKKLGLSQRLINYTHIEVRNTLAEPKFKKVPSNERVLLLSHCLRNTKECRAKYGAEGLECTKCGKCKIPKLMELAEKKGYLKSFVLPGGSMVEKLAKKYSPKAIVGVACYAEINMGIEKLNEYGIPSQGVLLLKEGCHDTDVNIEEVKEKIALIDSALLNGDSLKKGKKD